VSGSQVNPGSIGGPQVAQTLSARTLGGIAQFVAAATPYNWTFAVTGTPADNSYFSCTPVQALPIAPGDTFSNTSGLGSPFTVTSVDQVSATQTNVHFTPDATGVMSTGTVQGGKNGDTWVNTSAGNQVNQWSNGVWVAIQWNAANVITANTITASQIAVGILLAGVVDGTTIMGATLIADGSSGEILVYSGTPAAGNLIGSWSGASGTDGSGNAYPAGLGVEIGGLILFNQASPPSAVTGASSFYSSVAGRPRYLNSVGNDSVLERSTINVSQFTVGATTTFGNISAVLNYLANEGNQSSEYEIEIDGAGTEGTTARNLDFRLYIDGVQATGGFTIDNTVIVASAAFKYTIAFRVAILTTGATGTIHIHSYGGVYYNDATAGAIKTTTNAVVGGDVDGVTFDTTANHTLQLRAAWGNATGAGSLTTYRTKAARRM
jgi:hypothetical protein